MHTESKIDDETEEDEPLGILNVEVEGEGGGSRNGCGESLEASDLLFVLEFPLLRCDGRRG